MENVTEPSRWEQVKEFITKTQVWLGPTNTRLFQTTPQQILNGLSYYKFAAKMIGSNKRVLDVGCGEGIGTWLLAKECGYAKGIDTDADNITLAQTNWNDAKVAFECTAILNCSVDTWDAIISLDVSGRVVLEQVRTLMTNVVHRLNGPGIFIMGIPNLNNSLDTNSQQKFSFFSPEQLEGEMRRYFEYVFLFGAYNEIIQAGLLPSAHYWMAMGCKKKNVGGPVVAVSEILTMG
jgi:2-polyprenyl-3-methyl-5-hydroxy-6-metoxy-1,4-benzoquinol methylase